MEVKIQIIDDRGQAYKGLIVLTKQIKSALKKELWEKTTKKTKTIKPSDVIFNTLYQNSFFQNTKQFSEVEKKLNSLGYNFQKGSILMALKGASYLIRSGKRRAYKFVQKHPPIK